VSKPLLLSACVAVAFSMSCVLGALTLDGKTCESNADCPIPYSCLRQSDGERACYLADAPLQDGGPTVPLFTPDYCKDTKPILDQFCTGSCHATGNTVGSGRTDFRLDAYGPAGAVVGAKAKASAIRNRAYVLKDMPPPGSPLPTDVQRKVLADWAQGGAPECLPDGGM
jgi:hypothetical protein